MSEELTDQPANNEEKDQSYVIQVDNFQGPLAVLWDLIKNAKIDITEVSLADITEQYINFLKMMERMNVRVASEFIWMASELLYYKSKALLPSEDLEDEFFTPPLPPELIEKLLEYKRYQQSSQLFKDMYEVQTNVYSREPGAPGLEPGENDDYLEVSLFDLLKAFANVLDSQTTVEQEEIVFDEILVSDRIEHIADLLKEKEYILFAEIFTSRPNRAEIIASFLAILEMAKTKFAKILQHRVFGEIRIYRNFSSDQIASDESNYS